MLVKNTIHANFKCSIERAFKTPILGDATKMLTGYGVIPACIGFIDDETWGQAGGHRVPITGGNLFTRQGRQAFDLILVREENKYWKWQIDDFEPAMFFASKAQGEWWCSQNTDGTIAVQWDYTLYSRNIFTHPITLVFVKIFWLGMQKMAIRKMKAIAESDITFVYR